MTFESTAQSGAPTRDDVEGATWTFGNGARIFAKQLRLLHDGRISGYVHENEAFWDMHGEILSLYSDRGSPTTRFDHWARDAAGSLLLGGAVTADPGVMHVLRQVVRLQTLAPDQTGFPLDTHVAGFRPGAKRRNLVILFANQDSLHHQWPRDIDDAERSWDLCISFYGPEEFYRTCHSAELSSLQTGIGKCAAAHAAFSEASPLWAYERIWFADDDLMTSWSDINAMFAIARAENLLMSQPSLGPGSHVVHDITRQQPGNLLRYTSFVEAMAPLFTRAALRLCIPVFQGQTNGWGIDHIWPKLFGTGHNRIAIIDKVAVVHTRPSAHNYDRTVAAEAERRLLSAYAIEPEIRQYGSIRI